MVKDYLDPETGELFGGLDDFGHEIPDPRPVRIPSGFKRPETLAEQVQRLVRTQVSREAEQSGMESFEEAEDFDVDDDFDPNTPYETFFDPSLGKELTPAEVLQRRDYYEDQYIRMRESQAPPAEQSAGAEAPAPARSEDGGDE